MNKVLMPKVPAGLPKLPGKLRPMGHKPHLTRGPKPDTDEMTLGHIMNQMGPKPPGL